MTTREAGEYLGGISDSRVRQYIQAGRLRPEKFGHVNVIPLEQLQALKAELEQAPERRRRGRRPKLQESE